MSGRQREAFAPSGGGGDGAPIASERETMMPYLRQLLAGLPQANEAMRAQIRSGAPLRVKGHVVPCEWLEQALLEHTGFVGQGRQGSSSSSSAAATSSASSSAPLASSARASGDIEVAQAERIDEGTFVVEGDIGEAPFSWGHGFPHRLALTCMLGLILWRF